MSLIHCILQVRKTTEENGWILVSDTAWPGYEDIPTDIMAGYGTIFRSDAVFISDNRIFRHCWE